MDIYKYGAKVGSVPNLILWRNGELLSRLAGIQVYGDHISEIYSPFARFWRFGSSLFITLGWFGKLVVVTTRFPFIDVSKNNASIVEEN